MEGWIADSSLSEADRNAIQTSYNNVEANCMELEDLIKADIQSATTEVSNYITVVRGLLSGVDADIAVVKSAGYEAEISAARTAQEALSPTPAALETESNGIIASSSSIVSTTTTAENILQSNYDTVQQYYNTISYSKGKLEEYLNNIKAVLVKCGTYKTEMEGYLADSSITGVDHTAIQSSYNNLEQTV